MRTARIVENNRTTGHRFVWQIWNGCILEREIPIMKWNALIFEPENPIRESG